MRKQIFMRGVSALALLAGLFNSAFAQQGSLVQQSGSRLDAGQNVAVGTNWQSSGNASVATTAATAGQYVYVTGLYMETCQDATGAPQVNVNWTTTNLGGALFGYSTSSGADSCLGSVNMITFATPLKAAAPGTAVVLTSPSGSGYAHIGYGAEIFYYIAP